MTRSFYGRRLGKLDIDGQTQLTLRIGEKDDRLIPAINTVGLAILFGKHEGELFTRLPLGYLKWMLNNQTNQWRAALSELDRRGTEIQEIELSAHSIDRASQKCLERWNSTHKPNEGLYSWLARVSLEATKKGLEDQRNTDDHKSFYHAGMKFVFAMNCIFPMLKTVMVKECPQGCVKRETDKK